MRIDYSTVLNRATSLFWQQHDGKLCELAAFGATTQEVAAALGVSKNSVISRARRIGVLWARSPEPPPPKPARAWDFPPAGRCVFPHGDVTEAGFHFCGGEVVEFGEPYCAEHFLLTHVRQTNVVGAASAA